jgi:hypothetical protein
MHCRARRPRLLRNLSRYPQWWRKIKELHRLDDGRFLLRVAASLQPGVRIGAIAATSPRPECWKRASSGTHARVGLGERIAWSRD